MRNLEEQGPHPVTTHNNHNHNNNGERKSKASQIVGDPAGGYLHWTADCSKPGTLTDKNAILGSTLHDFPLLSSTEH